MNYLSVRCDLPFGAFTKCNAVDICLTAVKQASSWVYLSIKQMLAVSAHVDPFQHFHVVF